MKERKFQYGLLGTAAYLGIWTGIVYINKDTKDFLPTSLNAWGDSFAGIFSPIAFLWLVLGYLQQGQELRNSSSSLKIQAEELRNSVTAQSELVEVSKQQLQQEIQALNEEKEHRKQEAYPRFDIKTSKTKIKSASSFNSEFLINNYGGHAFNLVMHVKISNTDHFIEIGNCLKHATAPFVLDLYDTVEPVPATIEMTDENGIKHICTFKMLRYSNDAEVYCINTKPVE